MQMEIINLYRYFCNYLKVGTGDACPEQARLAGWLALAATKSMELVENLGTDDPTGSEIGNNRLAKTADQPNYLNAGTGNP